MIKPIINNTPKYNRSFPEYDDSDNELEDTGLEFNKIVKLSFSFKKLIDILFEFG